MPRRKKNGQSPARVPIGPSEGGSLGNTTAYRPPQGYDGVMANSSPSSSGLTSSAKENIVKNMQEMFSHLDPEVIYIVLSECDFKVEHAMDSLLELSVAAEVAAPVPSRVCGFERTAAALLSPHHFSEPRRDPDSFKPSQQPPSPSSINLLTDELDVLVDQELETLTAQQGVGKEHNLGSQHLSAGVSLSSFPPPPIPQQALPELLQSSLEPRPRKPSAREPGSVGSLVEHMSGASSPLDQLSTWKDETTERQELVVDFTHLTTQTTVDKQIPPLDLAASGRPSAFQVYKKQHPPHCLSEQVLSSDTVVGGARFKANAVNQGPLGYLSSVWNLEAPEFSPRVHANPDPAFITPVAQPPSNWFSQHRHASPWLGETHVSRAPLKPFATIPKSWALPAAPQPPAQYSKFRLEGKVLVLLRGAPGSGKTTMARTLLQHNQGGVILSTDDYFFHHGKYQFDPTALGEAHVWNHERAKEAFGNDTNPIIIDNTNMQAWEMKPYVIQALKYGYKVLFREPETWWKNKPRELQRRTTHNVQVETIRRMLNGYDRFVTVQTIMGSQMPEWKQCLHVENRKLRPVSSETPCPDLVEQPGLTEDCKKSRSQLFSSLPDVSSIGHSSEVAMLEDSTHKSTESLNFLPTGRCLENRDISDKDNDMDLGELDSELDAQLGLNNSAGGQRIPDCIRESAMNEDHSSDEIPVAFSESIGQRTRRERPSRRSCFDRKEPADLVKDTNQSKSEAKEKENKEIAAEGVEVLRDEAEKGEILDFVGDWPCEVSLEQRQVRRRERHIEGNGKVDEDVFQVATENKIKAQSGPDLTEFQKLLDLIQTGVAPIYTSSTHSSSLSQSSVEVREDEEDAGGRFEETQGSGSDTEAREQNVKMGKSSRCELPDCVLDWKPVDSCKARKFNNGEEIKTENEAGCATGENDHMSGVGREIVNLKSNGISHHSATTDDLLVTSKAAEISVFHNEVGSNNIADEVGKGCGGGHTDSDNGTEDDRSRGTEAIRTEAEDSQGSGVCWSPACEGFVETECSAFSRGSQEKKQHHGRRSGKQCKLALTFTQNCPAPSVNTLESTNTMAQNITSSQNSINTDVKSNCSSDCNTGFNLKPNFDLFMKSSSNAPLQPTSPLALVDTGCFTQTEPQDFALLWRVNHQGKPDKVVPECSHSSDFTALSANSSRFVPAVSTALTAVVAVDPSGHKEIPYRVVHEKGTQVEEKTLGATQDRLESLHILSRHFKLVSVDSLEDLYDKCHQDLEWTTNLLLDSGESFFRDEDGEEEKNGSGGEDDQNTPSLCDDLGEVTETRSCAKVLDECQSEDLPKEGGPSRCEEGTEQSTPVTVSESNRSCSDTCLPSFEGVAAPGSKKDHPDTTSELEKSPQTELYLPEATEEREKFKKFEHKEISESDLEVGAWGWSSDDGVVIEESVVVTEDEIASMDEIHRLLQMELEEMEREEKGRKEESSEKRHQEERRGRHLDIQSVELKLPTELALQLAELFGPVGVDPGTCSTDDYSVHMDMNLAKLLHQKWKETIQERQRQTSLSFHLLQDSSVHGGKSQLAKPGLREPTQPASGFSNTADGYVPLDSQPEAHSQMPFMDHWNVSRVPNNVSLRDIIKEEQLLQQNREKNRQSRVDLDQRDTATLLKENQLYSLFPTIDRHFLQDIFRDHNYSLSQTELFLRSLLDEEPIKTVVAPETVPSVHHRAVSKEREKKQKRLESIVPDYQDTEDPDYDDFRTEASLQRSRQMESFAKAAEAYKQGRKEVASFYAQQGHLHGARMREANHRAAAQIFERVNSSLLPSNILDLHGLHVDEALQHLAQVLQDKTTDCERGLCRPQLSVITGRGNHSQGGVARIRPAVIDYLTNKHYRFTEPKPGLVLISLK
ncbi:NEDD4-binding protein 2 isoform X1 [Mastacembelus armatus]|uniref:NEDD4 binding protein 2 n=1 Tax=Mastacembelus armatus TaxID=205130 RepID=A0A3Q3SSE8_9TELE|nr:NEDD4-binding protein 2 isoform X1 [Mastacembelus armatus]